jgi:hypothetical protein
MAVGFEDIPGGGDADFQDVVFSLDPTGALRPTINDLVTFTPLSSTF